ncbi:MAG: nucleotide pyrophosphohydrolase [Gammaproteobacteria bacterium]|nr:nucleotide pyrophosphohydrolase [Gammaproteobacteria bacterium]
MADSLEDLGSLLKAFARARDWEQFHTPKNLAMAMAVEAAEIMEHFQWKTPEQSMSLDAKEHREVALELADVFIYLMRLAQELDVDLVAVANEKMAINEERFPAGD